MDVTPIDVYPVLAVRYEQLDAQMKAHLPILRQALAASGRNLYYVDFFMIAATKRSMSLIDGFLTLLDSWNLEAAMSLFRSQLDNLLKTAYLPQAPDAEAFCRDFISGVAVNKMKDPYNPREKLTDKRLREYLKRRHPALDGWIDEVYADSSKFTHFSERSFYAAIASVNDESRSVQFHIGLPGYDEHGGNPSEDEIAMVMEHMVKATSLLLGLLRGYAETKRAAAR